MNEDTGKLVAAAVAGVVIGAFTTAVLMSNTVRATRAPVVSALTRVEPVAGTAGASRDGDPSRADSREAGTPAAIDPSVPTLSADDSGLVDELRARQLTIPVEGYDPAKLVPSFDDERGGSRRHESIDILAPRNTPVVAVEDGTIARLFMSKAGGITLYQYDPRERFVYYYAHLEAYADGLKEGAPIRRGQLIGYVGTTGNAPPGTPHLHFAIFEMTARKRWWEGRPIDPFLVLR